MLKSFKLSSLTINFDWKTFFLKIMNFYHLLKGIVLTITNFLIGRTNTSIIEFVFIFICVADRSFGIGAIILIILHRKFGCKFTSNIIIPIYSNINQSLWIFEKIITDYITSIFMSISDSWKLTIGVLCNNIFTLYGFRI